MKQRTKRGRPPKLTAGVAIELGLAVGRGYRFEAAAEKAGVGASTAWRWLAAARAGDPRYAAMLALRKPPPSLFDMIFATMSRRRRRAI